MEVKRTPRLTPEEEKVLEVLNWGSTVLVVDSSCNAMWVSLIGAVYERALFDVHSATYRALLQRGFILDCIITAAGRAILEDKP